MGSDYHTSIGENAHDSKNASKGRINQTTARPA